MARTIILQESQLDRFTRIDEILGGKLDQIRAAKDAAIQGYRDDKARNKHIYELRNFVEELYLIMGKKNGTLSQELYQEVRKSVSQRIIQIKQEIKSHGLGVGGDPNSNGTGRVDVAATQENLKKWKEWFGRNYTEEYLGKELYDSFEKCINMPIGNRNDFFYELDKKLKPALARLGAAKGFTFNG